MINDARMAGRVVSLSDVLDASGSWLLKRGLRFTVAGVVAGTAVASRAGSNALMIPVVAAAGTFGVGYGFKRTAAALNNGSYDAAVANSVRGTSEMTQTPEYTRHLAEGLWDNVAQYKSRFGGGDKERVVENICYALDASKPQMNQARDIGFSLDQVEAWKEGEIFESSLHKQYKNNLVLKSVRAKTKIPFGIGMRIFASRFPEKIIQNFTQRRAYSLAGKSMTQVNEGLSEGSELLDAQPFIWRDAELEEIIERDFGSDVKVKVGAEMMSNARKIFSDDISVARKQVYDMFDSDYLESIVRRMTFDSEYSAGHLDQTPEGDLAELESFSGQRPLSSENVDRIIGGISREFKGTTGQIERELDQVRIHHYLAREHIRFHAKLVEGWADFSDSKV